MQLGQEVPCQGQITREPGSAGTALCGSTFPFPGWQYGSLPQSLLS